MEVPECQLYCILLVKQITKKNLDSRVGERLHILMEEWYSYITTVRSLPLLVTLQLDHMDGKCNMPYVNTKLVASIPTFTFFIPISEEMVAICS